MGLKWIAVFVVLAGLALVIVSLFVPWMDYTFSTCCCLHTDLAGWNLIHGHDEVDTDRTNLTIELEEGDMFTGLAFVILVPMILATAILAGATLLKGRGVVMTMLLLFSIMLTAISLYNLSLINSAGSVQPEAGLWINMSGALLCLGGSLLLLVHYVKNRPASRPVVAT